MGAGQFGLNARRPRSVGFVRCAIFEFELDTPQRYPRTGSQSHPSPAAEASADGSTTIYFYSPLEPFFTKAWRPSEVELVH